MRLSTITVASLYCVADADSTFPMVFCSNSRVLPPCVLDTNVGAGVSMTRAVHPPRRPACACTLRLISATRVSEGNSFRSSVT